MHIVHANLQHAHADLDDLRFYLCSVKSFDSFVLKLRYHPSDHVDGFFPSYLARTRPALQGNFEAIDEKKLYS